ncbi:hypothetical protein ODU73_000438 [Thermoclostridium stercorarium]|uniref:hypothetical protein n=1 Tax=Thermoclostridium stercorarium TaxID=1510 RepID=UPI0022495D49|nr:hypothetical protein [Thermoclostridium stercorarium]UZQ86043.1 hypothetical protein ODU73_000438 [Thermoclostridium stercorarium]
MLEGYTIGTEEGIKEGTMVNQGAKIITPSTVNQAIPAGYHNGQGYVKGDANLKPENIKSGVSIFGKVGTYEGKILIGSTDTVTLIRSSSGSGRTGMLYITDIPFQPHFIYAYDETDGIADSFFIACDGLYNNLPKFQIKYDDRDSSFSGATQIGSFIDGGVEYHYPNWEGPRVHIGFQSDYIALYVGSGTYRYIIVG